MPPTRFADLVECVAETCLPSTAETEVYVGLEHIDSSAFQLNRYGHPDNVTSAKTRFRRGDILYGKLRPYLDKAILADREGICSTDILVFRPKPNVVAAYALGLIHSEAFRDNATATTQGVNHPRTSWNGVSGFECLVPPKPEQQKIAAVLWKMQRAIATQDRLIAATRDLKRSAMQRLFTHGLRGESLKDTEIGLMPESWSAARLESCCDVLSSRLPYTDFVAIESSEDKQAVMVHGVKVSDMNLFGNELRFNTANLSRRMQKDLAKRKAIPAGTVVFPKRGAAIATNKKRLTTTWTVLDPNLIGVRARKGLDTSYLFQWFEQFDLRTITESGPTPQLNKKNLVPLLLPIPRTEAEQRDIAAALAILDRKLALHQKKRAALNDLFQTTLHQLMTAQIRAADLDIDTSEVTTPSPQGVAA